MLDRTSRTRGRARRRSIIALTHQGQLLLPNSTMVCIENRYPVCLLPMPGRPRMPESRTRPEGPGDGYPPRMPPTSASVVELADDWLTAKRALESAAQAEK